MKDGFEGFAAVAAMMAIKLSGPFLGAVVALSIMWPQSWKDAITRLVVSVIVGWSFGPMMLDVFQWWNFKSATLTSGEIMAGMIGYPIAGVIYTKVIPYVQAKMGGNAGQG